MNSLIKEIKTHSDSPLKYERLTAWTLAERKCADRLSRLVFVGQEQIVKTLMAQSLEEPFTGCTFRL